ncbi:MAG: nitrite/sulfite reductase [Campylobacterota bacterium]
MQEKRETKTQRVERIKEEKDGLDVLEDIHRYAKTGQTVDPEDIDRFKWYGLYSQNTYLQAKHDKTLYFMLRIKLEKGEMNAEQVQTLGEIAERYANNTADFTTRQDLQFHWIQVKDLPAVFERLEAVGLSSQLAAGDCPRNVVSCPVSGVDHDEIADVRHLVDAVNDLFRANRDFSNLPRKFKIGISGCSKHCSCHEIQDLSFCATQQENGEVVYDVHVGGGLGKNKRIATHIGYVHEDKVVPVSKAITKIFRDHGNRTNRSKARIGHLIELWGVEEFVRVLHNELGFELDQLQIQNFVNYSERCHFGVHASKVSGESYIGCAVLGGRIGAEGLLATAALMREYGVQTLKATTTQNIVLLDVPSERTDGLVDALEKAGVSAYPSAFKARTLSCTGLNFCKFAVSETKDLAQEIVTYLETALPDFAEPVSISVTGCANACAHPYIVDIGLVGTMVRRGKERIKGFELICGGKLAGDKSHYSTSSGIKVTPDEAPKVIEELLVEYQQSNFESFESFILERA